MAETFGLAFDESKKHHRIGDLSKEQVESTLEMMKGLGFTLGRVKVENSL